MLEANSGNYHSSTKCWKTSIIQSDLLVGKMKGLELFAERTEIHTEVRQK